MMVPRIALSSLIALAVGCGGAPAPKPEGAPLTAPDSAKTAEAAPDAPPAKPAEEAAPAPAASEAPPAKPAEEAAPAPEQPPDAPCDVKPAAAAAAAKGPKLELTVDRAKVDLERHQLEVKLSRPACKVVLKVLGESGAVLANLSRPFDGSAAGTALVVSWSPKSTERVSRIEVWGHDTAGFFVGVAITPWNVKIDHEEVAFENDSDAIRASEVPKLEASLQKVKVALSGYQGAGTVSLFIKGHTDAVGSAEHNINLSRRRARAIGAWFRSHGIKSPIAYEGMGEHSQLVKTEDEVAEPRNRRVDYILSIEPPPLPTGPVAFAWKGV